METKVAAGAAALLLAWVVKLLWQVDVPAEIKDALTILLTVAVMWITPEKNPSRSSIQTAVDRGLAKPPDPPAEA